MDRETRRRYKWIGFFFGPSYMGPFVFYPSKSMFIFPEHHQPPSFHRSVSFDPAVPTKAPPKRSMTFHQESNKSCVSPPTGPSPPSSNSGARKTLKGILRRSFSKLSGSSSSSGESARKGGFSRSSSWVPTTAGARQWDSPSDGSSGGHVAKEHHVHFSFEESEHLHLQFWNKILNRMHSSKMSD